MKEFRFANKYETLEKTVDLKKYNNSIWVENGLICYWSTYKDGYGEWFQKLSAINPSQIILIETTNDTRWQERRIPEIRILLNSIDKPIILHCNPEKFMYLYREAKKDA